MARLVFPGRSSWNYDSEEAVVAYMTRHDRYLMRRASKTTRTILGAFTTELVITEDQSTGVILHQVTLSTSFPKVQHLKILCSQANSQDWHQRFQSFVNRNISILERLENLDILSLPCYKQVLAERSAPRMYSTCSITAPLLHSITKLKALQELRSCVASNSIPSSSWANLSALQHLTCLRLVVHAQQDADFCHTIVTAAPHLQQFELQVTAPVFVQHLSPIANLRSLHTLTFHVPALCDVGHAPLFLSSLSSITTLTSLDFKAEFYDHPRIVSQDAINSIQRLSNLQSLSISGIPLDQYISQLTNLQQLTHMGLNAFCTAAELAAASCLPLLQSFKVGLDNAAAAVPLHGRQVLQVNSYRTQWKRRAQQVPEVIVIEDDDDDDDDDDDQHQGEQQEQQDGVIVLEVDEQQDAQEQQDVVVMEDEDEQQDEAQQDAQGGLVLMVGALEQQDDDDDAQPHQQHQHQHQHQQEQESDWNWALHQVEPHSILITQQLVIPAGLLSIFDLSSIITLEVHIAWQEQLAALTAALDCCGPSLRSLGIEGPAMYFSTSAADQPDAVMTEHLLRKITSLGSLQNLKLVCLSAESDDALCILAAGCKQLQQLTLRGVRPVSRGAFAALVMMKGLRVLRVLECGGVGVPSQEDAQELVGQLRRYDLLVDVLPDDGSLRSGWMGDALVDRWMDELV